jgi:hypothetical protein
LRGGAFRISRGGAYFYYAAARLGLFAAAYKTNPTPQYFELGEGFA